MFYQSDNQDVNLRFGDVISGFQFLSLIFDDLPSKPNEFNLQITHKEYFVILTPCCSIEDGILVITPLEELRINFFENPYYVQDFTRINRIASVKDILPEKAWDQMPEEERLIKLAQEPDYPFIELFVYSDHPLLPRYSIKKKSFVIETGYYMINFKNILKINSKVFNRPVKYPKILELTIHTREELRKKIANYYLRVPQEDKIEF